MPYDPAYDGNPSRQRDEVYSERVPAGRRTYFFDVKRTRSGEDYFVTITESKRVGENLQRHKIFVYKEDLGKFAAALHRSIDYIRENHFPDFDFRGLPDVIMSDDYDDEEEG